MGFGPAIWSHSLVLLIAVLLTSGIWLTAYFVGVKNNNTTNNYIYTNENKCNVPEAYKCADTCEFVICESIPVGMQFNSSYPIYNSTTDCWMRLMKEAKEEIIIGSFYWSLLASDLEWNYTSDPTNTSANGKLIYDTILSTAVDKNVDIRIAQTYEDGGYKETTDLAAASKGKIRVRSLDFTQWYPGGILHTKSWSVDGKHLYIGSANFDWRSLTQVKELGLAVFNCPCLGADLKNLLEIYWEMGAPGAKVPDQWRDSVATPANHESPTSVPQPTGAQAAYISASPPGFRACGREDDLTAMIKEIDAAKEYVNLAVMDYAPSTLYLQNNLWEPRLDTALRRAAFERGVKVQFMVSRWPHTKYSTYGYLHSLQDLTPKLPCVDGTEQNCTKRGSIEVRMIQVPTMTYGIIPYARVYHNKYFVTESTSYVGTSNWSADYWDFTAGIGLILRSDDVTRKSALVESLNGIFLRDWNSNYTIPITAFDNSGNNITYVPPF